MSNERKRRALLLWIVVFLWMMLIYYLSAQPASKSNKLSNGVTKTVVEMVVKITPGMDLSTNRVNHIVRKSAHFFAYLLLASLVLIAWKKSGMAGMKAFTLTFLVCVIYAVTDEVHQLFVPGRGGQAKDVLIDSSGAIVGLIICSIVGRRRQSIRDSKQ